MRFKQGSRGDYVDMIQRTLSRAGLYDGRIDGYYGPKTESSVRDWQFNLGIPVTGEWDASTSQRTAEFLTHLKGVTGGTVIPAWEGRPARRYEGHT